MIRGIDLMESLGYNMEALIIRTLLPFFDYTFRD